ncbi:uncharacterized protein KIAA1143 homolog [Achroia grisella]|uniref:uncharacterized protein KIAA1143 homolog n=1 Tax=Achroia grisella TaxID=688607 RepID=UPI0027D24512|nr:uncharacterized protein KIAA1143 homolog [Achroia grisella]
MNRKRNVSYIKPEDPEFLKVLKRQAGYDDKNHKFDKLEIAEDDFVDNESEQPQVVVLKEGDLTAEEAEIEQTKIDKIESQTKADLNERVIFKSKSKQTSNSTKQSKPDKNIAKVSKKKSNKKQLLSFIDCDDVSDKE